MIGHLPPGIATFLHRLYHFLVPLCFGLKHALMRIAWYSLGIDGRVSHLIEELSVYAV
jgi:hypothetical protein